MSLNSRLPWAAIGVALNLFMLTVELCAGSDSQVQSPAGYGMTSGRFVATSAAVIGLLGVVLGGFAIARPAAGSTLRIVAMVAGSIAVLVGGWRVLESSGVGTGGGRAGAIVAVVLGVIAIASAGFALFRSRTPNEQGR